jgi:hypothetical protein
LKEYFENLYIINRQGICYYHKKFNPALPDMNEKSFSGFITAILTFTKDVFQDASNKVTLGTMDIYLQSFEEFFVVLSCKKGNKNEKSFFNSISEIG